MTLQEFIDRYTGVGVDFDGHYGFQCMDLYRQYVKQVLGFPQSPAVSGAINVWDTYLPTYFDRIENTPSGVPQRGDIVIWGTTIGQYGHIAVFVEGSATSFTSFDQNFPVGSLPHLQNHTYKGVLGWLRPKTQAVVDPTPPTSESFSDDEWTAIKLFTAYREEREASGRVDGNWESFARAVLGSDRDYPHLIEERNAAVDHAASAQAELDASRTLIGRLQRQVDQLTAQLSSQVTTQPVSPTGGTSLLEKVWDALYRILTANKQD